MVSNTYLDGFIPAGADHNECINCGICLQNCPVMEMEQKEAEAEIVRLIKAKETKRVLNECTFCFSCNHYCPNITLVRTLTTAQLELTNNQFVVNYALSIDEEAAMNYPRAIYDKAQRLEQLVLRTEAGESFESVRAALDLRVEEQDLPKLRVKYEAGGRQWEALIDGRHGHSQKAHSAIREWMYGRKRADESLTAPELAEEVQERFGVQLSAGHVNYLLRKVELTRPPGRPQRTEQTPSSETTTSANETGSSIGNAGLFFPRSREGRDGGNGGD